MGIALCPVPEPKTVKHRVHLDVHTDSVDTLLALGRHPGAGLRRRRPVDGAARPRGRRALRLRPRARCRRTATTSWASTPPTPRRDRALVGRASSGSSRSNEGQAYWSDRGRARDAVRVAGLRPGARSPRRSRTGSTGTSTATSTSSSRRAPPSSPSCRAGPCSPTRRATSSASSPEAVDRRRQPLANRRRPSVSGGHTTVTLTGTSRSAPMARIELTVDGATGLRRRRTPDAARAVPPREARQDRHRDRLRHQQLRRLHRAPRRAQREVLQRARRAGQRARGDHDRGPRPGRRAARGAGGLPRVPRASSAASARRA